MGWGTEDVAGAEGQEEEDEAAGVEMMAGGGVRMGETREKRTSGAQDAASVTQAERCALHHMHVLYLSDGGLAILRRRKGGNLVDIRTSCIRL